ncbi:MAG: class I SAM-dependent methyltransferase [Desulfobacteraceae bacterium]|nr:MAG: class I SAM-dependent methyltransferase [Desulfobacteraceae bacterium]
MHTVDFGRLELRPGSRVLDVGCGSGRHVSAAYLLPRTVTVGVDAAAAELAAARERLMFHDRLGAHGGGRWHLCAADGMRLPFAAEVFDAVVCSEVLEHLFSPDQAVAEMMRVLKPGGHFVVSVPRRWPERLCWALARDYAGTPGGHVRIFNRSALLGLLERRGARCWHTHHAHSLHTPFWWLKCLTRVLPGGERLAALYHRFLTWDLMRKPRLLRFIERLLNPLLGKSVVVYLKKR